MSFWTTFHFFRPGPPPRITTSRLADFVEQFQFFVRPRVTTATCELIHGRRIDKNTRPIDEQHEVRIGEAFISTSSARHLDINLFQESNDLTPTIAALRAVDNKSIYRAELGLGDLRKEDLLSYSPSQTSDIGLWIGAFHLTLGPITLASLDGDEQNLVSFLALSIGGQGQLWPRTSPQVRADLERISAVQHAMILCHEFWPAENRTAPPPSKTHPSPPRTGPPLALRTARLPP